MNQYIAQLTFCEGCNFELKGRLSVQPTLFESSMEKKEQGKTQHYVILVHIAAWLKGKEF